MNNFAYGYAGLSYGENAYSNVRPPSAAPAEDNSPIEATVTDVIEDAPEASASAQTPEETATGQSVLDILSLAGGWAATLGRDDVDIDCVILVLARHQPGLLRAAGVTDVDGLKSSLGSYVMDSSDEDPRRDDPPLSLEVKSVRYHALGRACEKGRDESTLEDLLDAIAYAIRSGHLQSRGAQLLRTHWRIFAVDAVLTQVMDRLTELQNNVKAEIDDAVETRLRPIVEGMKLEHGAIERLAIEMGGVREHMIARPTPVEIPKKRPFISGEFLQRVNILRRAPA